MSPGSGPRSPEMEAVRRRVLERAVGHVAFDGWTETAFAAGAEDAGIPLTDARRAFPGGASDLLDFFLAEADRRMVEALERHDLPSLRIRERIATAVRVRLEQHADHREAVRHAVGVHLLPHNAVRGARSLYRTVDAIWRAAGDTATDFNFYTKRGLLAGVYTATLLYWLDDQSPDFVDSWGFLARRIDDVMAIERLRGRLSGGGRGAPPLRRRNPLRRRA